MLDNENKLIEEAREGGQDSFRRLYEHYSIPIYRFVFLRVNDRKEAEDLTHEVFLASWKNIRSYKSRGFPFSSWLYRIARNKVIDHYRTRKDHLRVDEVEEGRLGIIDSIPATMDTKLSFERVKRHFDELTPDQKDVAIMRFVEEMSHKEIAKALGKSEGAVRLIQHRALNSLKDLLGDDPPAREV
jgi:RNA polymerase sigma-70 factor, ECF subfamily